MIDLAIDLSSAQQEAVDARGVVLVSAGAGSGKTTMLVERAARAVEDGVDPEAILVVTFTERAAGELAERLRERLAISGAPDRADRVRVSTIHGLCGVDPARARVRARARSRVPRARRGVGGDRARRGARAGARRGGRQRRGSDARSARRVRWRPAAAARRAVARPEALVRPRSRAPAAAARRPRCPASRAGGERAGGDRVLRRAAVGRRGEERRARRGARRAAALGATAEDLVELAAFRLKNAPAALAGLPGAARRTRVRGAHRARARPPSAGGRARPALRSGRTPRASSRARRSTSRISSCACAISSVGDADARAAVQDGVRHLLVDEFQDTNALQDSILELVAGPMPSAATSATSGRASTASAMRTSRCSAGGAPGPGKVVRLDDCFRSSDPLVAGARTRSSAGCSTTGSSGCSRAERPVPADGARSSCWSSTSRARSGRARARGDRPRRAARRAARAGHRAVADGRAPAGEHRRRAVRGRAPPGGVRHAPGDRRRLLRPPAGLGPVRVPASPAQPVRRSRAPDRARLSAHRRLQRRAVRASARRPRPRSSAGSSTGCRTACPTTTRG